jgi:hypothetical protein
MIDINKVIVLAGSLLVADTAIAANWVAITKVSLGDDNGQKGPTTVYIDKDSINKKDNIMDFWKKDEYKIAHTKLGKQAVITQLLHCFIDCKKKTVSINESVVFDTNDHPVVAFRSPMFMKPIFPDLVLEEIYTIVCAPNSDKP